MTDTWYDILEWCSEGKTKKDRIARLHKNSGPELKQILGYTYDPGVKWLLPKGPPPYKPVSSAADIQGQFKAELRRLYLFVEGDTETQRNLKPIRREQLFIELLEAIHPNDALLLVAMSERKLPFKNLTREIVSQAFPNMSKNW
jgi:hypothetical protein